MIALARKYRPKRFADVAVQSHVSNTLRGAIARGRVAHGYLLCGPRGTGKTTLARVLAMALNCEQRDASGEPCGTCTSCTRIWSGSASLDVVEIDAASNRGVDDARELRERAMYAPTGDDRYKVYIVDEAHMLTREAWNALLKILEEPPPRVVFVFATTEPQKIAQAAAPVLSRLQRFDLKRIGPADIRARLETVLAAEHMSASPDALAMIARAADGSMRDALSLTDQVLALGDGAVSAERVRDALGLVPEDEYLAALDLIANGPAADAFAFMARLSDAGVDFVSFMGGLSDILRAQLAIELGGAPTDLSDRMRDALNARKGTLAAADLLRMLNEIGELEPRFRRSGQQQLLLETLLVRFALMDRALSLEDVLRGIDGGTGGSGAAALPRPPVAAPQSGPGAPPRLKDRASSSPSRDHLPATAIDSAPPAPPAPPAPSAPSAPSAHDVAPAAERIDVPVPREVVVERDARPANADDPPPDLNRLVEHWDRVVTRVRDAGRLMLATVLERVMPDAITPRGVVTIQLDDASAEPALEAGRDDLLTAMRAEFPGITRVVVRRSAESESARTSSGPKRITEDEVRRERVAGLRRKDAVLAAAMDALDLDLVD